MIKRALVATALAALAVALPAVAHADTRNFQTPSGNIDCTVAADGAACDIGDHTFSVPLPPECAKHSQWGIRFSLDQGKPGMVDCHSDTLHVDGEPTLVYGQTLSVGSISCESEPAGVTCSDANSGHSFQLSRDSYSLG